MLYIHRVKNTLVSKVLDLTIEAERALTTGVAGGVSE